MKEKKWYADGIRFSCLHCGVCCSDHGEYTYVYVLRDEHVAIAEYLGITPDEFKAAYCDESGDYMCLKMNGPDCPFFKNKQCAIYPVRPTQCRTWPFWMENLKRQTWDRDVFPFCPGIGHGRLYTEEEIDTAARENEEGFYDSETDDHEPISHEKDE